MKKTILLLIVSLLSGVIKSQDISDMVQKTGFIIISASKKYEDAKKTAIKASKTLGYKLDLRDLQANADIGLSFSKEVCEDAGFDFPCNVQRGRSNENKFVSVEYTNMYDGFSKGFYIVVVATYPENSAELKPTLKYVKKYFKSAYIRYTDVYMGCIH